jgi:hypothetical protein
MKQIYYLKETIQELYPLVMMFRWKNQNMPCWHESKDLMKLLKNFPYSLN